jgi:hypothetical protein
MLDAKRLALMKNELYQDHWSVDTMIYLTRCFLTLEQQLTHVIVVDSLLLSIIVDTPDTNPAVATQIRVLQRQCSPPTLNLIILPLYYDTQWSLLIYLPHYKQWLHFTTGKKHERYLSHVQSRLHQLNIVTLHETKSLCFDVATHDSHIIFYIYLILRKFDILATGGYHSFLGSLSQEIPLLSERYRKSFLLRLEAIL